MGEEIGPHLATWPASVAKKSLGQQHLWPPGHLPCHTAQVHCVMEEQEAVMSGTYSVPFAGPVGTAPTS